VTRPDPFTTWDDVSAVIDLVCHHPAAIDLVGPKGFIHGWIKVGPGSGDVHTVDVGSFENDKVNDHLAAAKRLASAGHYQQAADHLTTAARHAKATQTQKQLIGARNKLIQARKAPANRIAPADPFARKLGFPDAASMPKAKRPPP